MMSSSDSLTMASCELSTIAAMRWAISIAFLCCVMSRAIVEMPTIVPSSSRIAEMVKDTGIVLIRSVVLRYGPGHGLHPVLATEPAHRVPLGKRRLPGQGACREYVVEFQLKSQRDPGVLVVGHPGQTDRDPGRIGKSRLESVNPLSRVAHSVLVGDEQAVAPMEVGVVRGTNDQMVLAVLNDGATVFEDGEVCCPARREGAHGVTVPEDRRAALYCADA